MKILTIATTKFELDGITNVIMNYYRAIDKTDMQIDFVTPNKINDQLRFEIENNNGKIYDLSMRNKKPFEYIKRLSKIIKNESYDIVHVHGNSCTLALEMYTAKKCGVKVRIPHSHNTKTQHKIIHEMLRRTFDSTYSDAFACGQKAGEWLYNDKPFKIINNGIHIDKYKYNMETREIYRCKYNLTGKKVIGHIGHFSHQKNHDYLIDVFAELFKLDKNYRLILIGDGGLRTDVEKKVDELGLSNVVIFTGKTLEVSQLMQAIDVLVMPSRFEGLPLTLVEAQTACLPCFVSDAVSEEAAITNLVEYVSLKKYPKEWAEQINAASPVNREELKNDIYCQIRNAGYSIKDNADNLKKMYYDLLNKL